MTYVIKTGSDTATLIATVNTALDAGWHLVGGVAYDADNNVYAQAMAKEEAEYVAES